jgi:hypothetical protein
VKVRIAPLAGLLWLLSACTHAEATSSVVVNNATLNEAVVMTNEDLTPGDLVNIWRSMCSRHGPNRCRYRQVGRGMVTTIVPDSPDYALIELAPGTRVALGDRATKDGPIFYWHPDPPSE